MTDITVFLFPLRAHLLAEIDYLKAQLAQERRRVDVLQDGLIQAKRPPITAKEMISRPVTRSVPKGWDATRVEERNARVEEVPAGLTAGSDGQVASVGTAA